MKKIDSLETLREEQQALERKIDMTGHAFSRHSKAMGQQIKKDLVQKVLIPVGGTAVLGLVLKQVLGTFEDNNITKTQVKASGQEVASWSRWINIGLSLFRAWQKVNSSNHSES